MIFLIKLLIAALKLLQKVPYETAIRKLNHKVLARERHNLTCNQYKIQISFKHGAVFLNKTKIINEKAVTAGRIFEILFDQFIKDKKSGLDANNHTFVSIKRLAKTLENNGFVITDVEKQVRWPLNKIRRLTRGSHELCVPENEEIIEIRRCGGIDSKDYGYRLNARLVFV
jgi:hypothetical protein